jgi:hypothetical protein
MAFENFLRNIPPTTKHESPPSAFDDKKTPDKPGKPSDIVSDAADDISKQKPKPKRTGPKVGRNDPCPCGSGKKYKNCCGK